MGLSGGREQPLNLPVISTSLDVNSKSRKLAAKAADFLTAQRHHAPLVDLAGPAFPPFDNAEVFSTPEFKRFHDLINKSDGIVLAFPIYNWAPPAQLKSLIEATGATGDGVNTSAWFDKLVTFICAAGLPQSYMATGALAQSLMLDFKCVINPYTGYFASEDWQSEEQGILLPERDAYFHKTLTVHQDLARLLRGRSYRSDWEV